MRAGCENLSPSGDTEKPQMEGQGVQRNTDSSPGAESAGKNDLAQVEVTATRVVRTPGMQDDHLRILAVGHVNEQVQPRVLVLVDTGAQISLIRKGLVPPHLLQPAKNPIRLMAANQQRLEGGDKEIRVDLTFDGICDGTGEPVKVVAPGMLYEADIADDVIVSYSWLGQHGFDISPREHGIRCQDGEGSVWVPGLRPPGTDPAPTPVEIRHTSSKVKRALDLF